MKLRRSSDELLDDLRKEMTQLQLDQAAAQMASATPEEREHLRSGLDALNKMLEQRQSGEPIDPSFESFMNEYGDLFPGNPGESRPTSRTDGTADGRCVTDDRWNDCGAASPARGARREPHGDMDLAWQMDRLGTNLRDLLPNMGLGRATWTAWPGIRFSVLGSSDAVSQLAEIAELESLLAGVTDPGALGEVDLDRVPATSSATIAAKSLEVLAELTRKFGSSGLGGQEGRPARPHAGRATTPRRERALRALLQAPSGPFRPTTPMPTPGIGIDRDLETKQFRVR